jgi:hypothetical protein
MKTKLRKQYYGASKKYGKYKKSTRKRRGVKRVTKRGGSWFTECCPWCRCSKPTPTHAAEQTNGPVPVVGGPPPPPLTSSEASRPPLPRKPTPTPDHPRQSGLLNDLKNGWTAFITIFRRLNKSQMKKFRTLYMEYSGEYTQLVEAYNRSEPRLASRTRKLIQGLTELTTEITNLVLHPPTPQDMLIFIEMNGQPALIEAAVHDKLNKNAELTPLEYKSLVEAYDTAKRFAKLNSLEIGSRHGIPDAVYNAQLADYNEYA